MFRTEDGPESGPSSGQAGSTLDHGLGTQARPSLLSLSSMQPDQKTLGAAIGTVLHTCNYPTVKSGLGVHTDMCARERDHNALGSQKSDCIHNYTKRHRS